MTNLLTGSLFMMVLGLNLMVIRYILKVTGEIRASGRPGLIIKGGIITFLGLIVVGIGIAMWKYNWEIRPGDWSEIIKVGAAVVAIGGTLIIRTCGHGHLTLIKNGAWAAVGIGILLFLAYFIVPCLQRG